MTGVRVAINGFGTIGKRVAKAVQAQPDMIVSGVTKTGPSHGCALANRFGIPRIAQTIVQIELGHLIGASTLYRAV